MYNEIIFGISSFSFLEEFCPCTAVSERRIKDQVNSLCNNGFSSHRYRKIGRQGIHTWIVVLFAVNDKILDIYLFQGHQAINDARFDNPGNAGDRI